MNQDNVFGLDVPVKDFFFMNVTDGIQKVPDNEGSGFLGKSLSVLDDVVELAPFAELQNGVKVVLVVEEAVNPGDVGML